MWPYVWHCAYQAEFLRKNGIRFPDKLTLGEDLAFQFEATMMAKSVNCIDSVLYKYYHCRQDSSEMVFLSNPVERVKRHIKIIETCYDYFGKHGKRADMKFYDFAFEFLYRDIVKLNKKQRRCIWPYLVALCYNIDIHKTKLVLKQKLKFYWLIGIKCNF